MPGSFTQRRPRSDRITNVAGCVWVAGLVAWYGGASAAIDRTLDAKALFIPVVIASFIGGTIALFMEPKRDKGAFGTALFLAAGLAFLGFDLAALANRYADPSAALTAQATVLSFHDSPKGPPSVQLQLGAERVSFVATLAEGCRVDDKAKLELRDGAFGARWMQSIRCER
jgi:hypothetical protein